MNSHTCLANESFHQQLACPCGPTPAVIQWRLVDDFEQSPSKRGINFPLSIVPSPVDESLFTVFSIPSRRPVNVRPARLQDFHNFFNKATCPQITENQKANAKIRITTGADLFSNLFLFTMPRFRHNPGHRFLIPGVDCCSKQQTPRMRPFLIPVNTLSTNIPRIKLGYLALLPLTNYGTVPIAKLRTALLPKKTDSAWTSCLQQQNL